MKILALCDSPTLNSGFARVAQNLFKRWNRAGAVIDVWGVAFLGWGYKAHPYVNQFFPAGVGGEWCQPERLQLFLAQLQQGGYTHVWIMQDTFLLSAYKFPKALRKVCTDKGIVSMLYFPVDAPLDPWWSDIIAAVDVPVAYTEFGIGAAEIAAFRRVEEIAAAKEEERKDFETLDYSFGNQRLTLPHGVDTKIYRMLPNRDEIRSRTWEKEWVKPDDFLMININANQRRKDPSKSMEIAAILKQWKVPVKLVMHMSRFSDGRGVDLHEVAKQLGLKLNEDWVEHDQAFRLGQGTLPEEPQEGKTSLVDLYNAGDLYLTTTLGEGWGLGITEALACGTPVAMPEHTACWEIGDALNRAGMGDQRVMLPVVPYGGVLDHDNSRIRPRVNAVQAAKVIQNYYESGKWKTRTGLNQKLIDWMSWDRIAREMLKLMKRTAKKEEPKPEAP